MMMMIYFYPHSLSLVILDKHCRINFGKSWEKLETDLIRNELNFKSDLILYLGTERMYIFIPTLLLLVVYYRKVLLGLF